MKNKNKMAAFTLMEILIALFIFTILSMLLVSALRTVINADSGAEKKAERLHNLQMALLVISRDVEQAVDRPVINAEGKEEAAFIGTSEGFSLTHTGYANVPDMLPHGTLQRSAYTISGKKLWRINVPVLDATPKTKNEMRILFGGISEMNFKYLNDKGRFVDRWPPKEENNQPLPRGVQINLDIGKWGTMTQLYLIPSEKSEAANMNMDNPPPPDAEKPDISDRRKNDRRQSYESGTYGRF